MPWVEDNMVQGTRPTCGQRSYFKQQCLHQLFNLQIRSFLLFSLNSHHKSPVIRCLKSLSHIFFLSSLQPTVHKGICHSEKARVYDICESVNTHGVAS